MAYYNLSEKDRELIQRVTDHNTESAEHYIDSRREWEENIRFVELGEQWEEKAKRDRELYHRPALVVNLIRKYALNMAGVLQQEKIAVKVKGEDTDTDRTLAGAFDAVVENIEERSGKSSYLNTAIQHAITGGYGFVRVITAYENESTFNQEIRIERIINPLLVYPCPHSVNVNMADQIQCSVVGYYPKYLFEKEFGGSFDKDRPVNFQRVSSGSGNFNWERDNAVAVAEFFYKEPRKVEFALFANGQSAELEDATDEHGNAVRKIVGSGTVVSIKGVAVSPQFEIVKTKKIKKDVVMWCKVAGDRVIEQPREFPIQNATIPVFLLSGHEIWVGQTRYMRSLTYEGHDSQRMYNAMLTSELEVVMAQPFAPFMGTEAQIAKHQTKWEEAQKRLSLCLPYTPDNETNAPPPTRIAPPQGSQGIMVLLEIAKGNISDSIGRYANSLGDVGDRTSGKSLTSQMRLSDNTQYAFLYHLNTLVVELGRCILSMIPRVYESKQIERILGKSKIMDLEKNGLSVDSLLDDLSVTRFDFVVTASPSFATKREESLQALMMAINASPSLAPMVLDLVVKTMDFEFQDELLRRMKIINPDLFPDDPEAQKILAQRQAAQAQAQQQQMLEWERDKAGLEGKLIANAGRELKVNRQLRENGDEMAARGEVQQVAM